MLIGRVIRRVMKNSIGDFGIFMEFISIFRYWRIVLLEQFSFEKN